MKMDYDLQLFNSVMQYRLLSMKRNEILEVESIEKYEGKYTHMNTMNQYTVRFSSGRYAWLTDSLFEVVDKINYLQYLMDGGTQ